ncbi:hypothetical protein N431DRAFT_535657 [Stipitochalara longipes BDJ]|nr:hypothetical protein N431DRAFT_535657 [Stipitochalara longipes BDJ]
MVGRIFNSAKYFGYQEYETMHIDQRRLQRLSDDDKTLLIDIQGAIRRPNTNREMGAYGAYFGPGSSFNQCGLLPKDGPVNDQAAELYAAIVALRTVKENSLAAEIKLVVLKVASNYLPQHI